MPIDVVLATASLGPEFPMVEHHALDTTPPMVGNQSAGLLLLHLADPSSVAPMAIATSAPAIGSEVAALGWGDIQTGFDAWWPRSTYLKRTQLKVHAPAECPGFFRDSSPASGGPSAEGLPNLSSAGVCAVGRPGAEGVRCAADLGGPLVAEGSPDSLVGLVDAVRAGGPGGFADPVCGATVRAVVLAPHAAWISAHI